MASSTTEQLGDGFVQNPYAVYQRLRAEGPVSRVVMPGGCPVWVVTRYADARAALADPRLIKDWRTLWPGNAAPDDGFASLDTHMLSTDPPDHDRLRRLVTKAFTADGSSNCGRRHRDHHLAAGRDARRRPGGPAGGVRLPAADHGDLRTARRARRGPGRFRAWAADHVHRRTPAGAWDGRRRRWLGYFSRLVADKRAHPADDLLSALIAARDDGDRLSERELIAMAVPAAGRGARDDGQPDRQRHAGAAAEPGELARLRADPSLLPGAVEELLRHNSPVNHRERPLHRRADQARRQLAIPRGRRCWSRSARRTATRSVTRPPTGSTSAATPAEPGLRPRHPLLPGRAAGPYGRRDRLRRLALAIPRHDARGPSRFSALAPEHPHPRPRDASRPPVVAASGQQNGRGSSISRLVSAPGVTRAAGRHSR